MEKKEIKGKCSQLFWYFLFFSVIGLLLETLFCYITTGIWESRKGLLWGPFCPIYGVGAVVLILLLERFEDSREKIFFFGGILGCIVEYILSYILEAMYGTKFWDYSYKAFNLNGRICLTYALYWAILSLVLMRYIKPKLDTWISKIPIRLSCLLEYTLFLFLIVDAIFTVWSISIYEKRMVNLYYDIPQNPVESTFISEIEENYFSTERMSKIFPNIRVRDKNGREMFVRDILYGRRAGTDPTL